MSCNQHILSLPRDKTAQASCEQQSNFRAKHYYVHTSLADVIFPCCVENKIHKLKISSLAINTYSPLS